MVTIGLILFFIGLVTAVGAAIASAKPLTKKAPLGSKKWQEQFDEKWNTMSKMAIPGLIGGGLMVAGAVLLAVGLVQGGS